MMGYKGMGLCIIETNNQPTEKIYHERRREGDKLRELGGGSCFCMQACHLIVFYI